MANTMFDTGAVPTGYEHPLLSWRSIVAGLLISFLTFAILSSLGMAVGGMALHEIVDDGSSAKGLGIGAGVWLVLTVLISLFAGSYFAASVSTFVSRRSGVAQGLTIAALFFAIAAYQTGATISSVAGGLGSVLGAGANVAASQAGNVQNEVANSPIGTELQARVTRDLNLQSPPDVVAQGVVTRLVRGDEQGAKDYLAQQAGITPQEADMRINEVKSQVSATAKDAGKTASNVATGTGWSLFLMLILGALSASIGGVVGSRALVRVPRTYERRTRINEHAPLGV
jgi:hypothetical protein